MSVRGAWTRLLFTPLPTTPSWIIDPASKRWLSAQVRVDGQAVRDCARGTGASCYGDQAHASPVHGIGARRSNSLRHLSRICRDVRGWLVPFERNLLHVQQTVERESRQTGQDPEARDGAHAAQAEAAGSAASQAWPEVIQGQAIKHCHRARLGGGAPDFFSRYPRLLTYCCAGTVSRSPWP